MSASPYETVESVPMISDEEFEKVWSPPPGLYGIIMGVQNGPIGMRFIMTSFLFFIRDCGTGDADATGCS